MRRALNGDLVVSHSSPTATFYLASRISSGGQLPLTDQLKSAIICP